MNSGALHFNAHGHGYNTGGTIALNTWRHVALVRKAGKMTAYIDTKPAFMSDSGLNFSVTNQKLEIGYQKVHNHAFRGILDQIEIYRRALSPDELAARFNNGSGIACP